MKIAGVILIFSLILSDAAASQTSPGYAIITVSEINDLSLKLPDFVAHKESLGFDVQVVTEADFGGGTGDEAAENIKTWLQNHYLSDNIKYVLLIGDPDSANSQVPMKMVLIRDAMNIVMPAVFEPTDAYYARLSEDWDMEPYESGPLGRLAYPSPYLWDYQVMVGRIPCYKPYAGSTNDLDNILQKTIDYEHQTIEGTSIGWRKNALLAIDYYNGTTGEDFFTAEAIKNDILDVANWNSCRVYSQAYQDFYPEYQPETIGSSVETVCQTWDANNYGLVIWDSQRDPNLNGPCMSDSLSPGENHPGFTCHPNLEAVDPCNPENLVYTLLKKPDAGAVCSLASTHSYYSRTSSSEGGMAGNTENLRVAYEYTSRLVSGFTAGEALYAVKKRLFLHGPSPFIDDIFTFNLYGDPSLRLVNLQGKTIYVDASASGDNNGVSWQNAYNYLQDALEEAVPGDEIHLAQGTYRPDANSAIPGGTADRSVSFEMINDVAIKGGYAGLTEVDPNARDIILYYSVLSGEIGDPNIDTDNSFHIVTAGDGVCEASVLDGLVIADAYGDSNDPSFGALYALRAYPKACNCSFEANHADKYGVAVFCSNGAIEIDHCTFRYNSQTSLGAVIDGRLSKFILNNSIFYQNLIENGQGAIYPASTLYDVVNCTFANNPSTAALARFQLGDSSLSTKMYFTNSILYGNEKSSAPSQSHRGEKYFRYCDVEGVVEGEANIDVDPLFVDLANDDYHLKSQAGHWDWLTQNWVLDNITSPCIDAGDPNFPVGDEPAPNGYRINMGAYGGTYQASKTYSEGAT